jgi:hypothetical protein
MSGGRSYRLASARAQFWGEGASRPFTPGAARHEGGSKLALVFEVWKDES